MVALGLTRSQWFLLVTGPLIAWYFVRQVRSGTYRQQPVPVVIPASVLPRGAVMSDDMPDYAIPPERPEKKGLSTGCLVSLVALAIILLAFGICVAVVSSSGA